MLQIRNDDADRLLALRDLIACPLRSQGELRIDIRSRNDARGCFARISRNFPHQTRLCPALCKPGELGRQHVEARESDRFARSEPCSPGPVPEQRLVDGVERLAAVCELRAPVEQRLRLRRLVCAQVFQRDQVFVQASPAARGQTSGRGGIQQILSLGTCSDDAFPQYARLRRRKDTPLRGCVRSRTMIEMLLSQPRCPGQGARGRPNREPSRLRITRERQAQRMREAAAGGEDGDAVF